jgi:hypothetical protein
MPAVRSTAPPELRSGLSKPGDPSTRIGRGTAGCTGPAYAVSLPSDATVVWSAVSETDAGTLTEWRATTAR